MKKRLFYVVAVLMFLPFSTYQIYGQATSKTVALKKGEVLDILLISQNPDTKAEFQAYFKEIVPIASRVSYKSVTSLKINSYTQGNHRPNALVFGKWSSIKKREGFLKQVLKEVPDFHERRRKIWSYFGLSYFEMKKNVSFEINQSKYHIATAYWMNSDKASSKFYDKWKEQVTKMGGEIIITLADGTSPFGYRYNPHYFVISSWQDESSFKAFQTAMNKVKLDNIQHISEFVLE